MHPALMSWWRFQRAFAHCGDRGGWAYCRPEGRPWGSGPAEEDLARCGLRRDPGTDVNGDAAELAPHDVAFPGVQADPEVHSDLAHRPDHGARAGYGRGRGVERLRK